MQIRGRGAVAAVAVVAGLGLSTGQAVAWADDSGFGNADRGARSAFDFRDLIALSDRRLQERLRELQNTNGPISIADMFEMQMRINQLSQLSEIPRESPISPAVRGGEQAGGPNPQSPSGVGR